MKRHVMKSGIAADAWTGYIKETDKISRTCWILDAR
jgi:hypothetical protein